MGRLKLLHFGLGAPELFASEAVNPRGQGDGFENTLRNIASNKGLAYLVSPQIGEFWKTMVLLKPTYLQQSKWSGYKRLKNSSFKALLNFEVLDKSNEEVEDWEECVGYPGIKLLMPRSLKIKVRYQSERKYEEVEEEAKGFQARVMQQAHDHL